MSQLIRSPEIPVRLKLAREGTVVNWLQVPLPRLSVTFLSLDGGASLRKVVRHLSTHRDAGQIEIVVGITEDAPLALEPPQGFAGFRVMRAPVLEDFGRARAEAIRKTSAPFVVFGEDHSFPVEGWAPALLALLESGAAAVGPHIRVANPATSVSWTDGLLCYGAYLRPRQQDAVKHVPWHNSAYRRDVLLALGDRLALLLRSDTALQVELARQGHRFAMTPLAATAHCNYSLLVPHWVGLYWGNRLYGATRATSEGWPLLRRLAQGAAWPAIVGLRAWRAVRNCLALHDERIRYVSVLPLLLVGSVVAATGEISGYWFGLGSNALRRRTYAELNRARYVTASEVDLLKG